MKSFEKVLKASDISDIDAFDKSKYSLVHFHIEAFDDQIVLNKIDMAQDTQELTDSCLTLLKRGNYSKQALTTLNSLTISPTSTGKAIKRTALQHKRAQVNDSVKEDKQGSQPTQQESNAEAKVSEDLCGNSPDAKSFAKRKLVLMEYMKKMKETDF